MTYDHFGTIPVEVTQFIRLATIWSLRRTRWSNPGVQVFDTLLEYDMNGNQVDPRLTPGLVLPCTHHDDPFGPFSILFAFFGTGNEDDQSWRPIVCCYFGHHLFDKALSCLITPGTNQPVFDIHEVAVDQSEPLKNGWIFTSQNHGVCLCKWSYLAPLTLGSGVKTPGFGGLSQQHNAPYVVPIGLSTWTCKSDRFVLPALAL